MDGFPTTKETRNRGEGKKRGTRKNGEGYRRDNRNFENERHAPSSTPAIFLETNSKESFQPRVGCTRGGIGRRSCKRKKLPQLHPQRSIRSQLPTSANSTFFEPRVRTISFQDLHPRGSHEGNSPRWHARFCSREQRTHPWRRVVSRSRTGYTRRRRSKVAGSRVASFQRNSIGRLPSRSSAALSLPVEFTSIYCVRVVVDRPRSSVYPRLDLEISIPCLFIRGSMRATRDRLDILGHTRRSGSIGRSCRSRFLFVICLVWMDWKE